MTALPRAATPSRSDRGIVLVAVLWLLALLGGLTAAMSIFTTSTLSAIDVYKDRPRAVAVVMAGLNEAAVRIQDAVDRAAPIRGTATVMGARVRFEAVGESARIDVNMAPSELLAGLFTGLGAPQEVAAANASAIVALRGLPADRPGAAKQPPGFNPDEETPAGIEAAARGGLPKPGEQDPHKPFVDVVQLQRMSGMTSGLMARAAPFLTTFSGLAQIDPMVAAPEVIAALPGITRERVRTILDLRRRSLPPDGLDEALGDAKSFTTNRPAAARRIKVTAVLPDGFTTGCEIVIIRYPDDGQPYRILSWDDDTDMRSTPTRVSP